MEKNKKINSNKKNIKKRLLSLFLLPIIPLFLFIIINLSVILVRNDITQFASLSFYSLVEPGPKNTFTEYKTTKLLKGEKIKGEFKATEDNFGMVLVKFFNSGKINSDSVIFRLKEKGKNNWYYDATYKTDQFLPNQYFTFGFPLIQNAKDKSYDFEIESLDGTKNNAIALSSKSQNIAVVYQFSRQNLSSNLQTLVRFIYKKIFYSIVQLNGVTMFLIYILFLLLMVILQNLDLIRLKLDKLTYYLYSIFNTRFKKNNRFFKGLNSFYKDRRFPYYIAGFLFIISLIGRLSFYLDRENFQYATIYGVFGSWGDYDMLIKHTMYSLTNKDLAAYFWSFMNDYTIITRIYAFFFKAFGFINGINYSIFLFIFLGSIISLLPFFLLSRLKKFSWGGFLGSLMLAVNPLWVWTPSYKPIDTLTTFIFSIFIIFFIFSLEKKNYFIVFFLGVVAGVDIFNRGIMIFNDFPALFLFAIYYLYSKRIFLKKFPFLKFKAGEFLYAFFPLFVFGILYLVFSWWFLKTFDKPWFFSPQTILSSYNPIKSTDVVPSAGVNINANFFNKFMQYTILSFLSLTELVREIEMPIIFFVLIIFLLLLFKSSNKEGIIKNRKLKFLFLILPTLYLIFILIIRYIFPIFKYDTGRYPFSKLFLLNDYLEYVWWFVFSVYFLLQIIFLKKEFFKFAILIIFYSLMLTHGLYFPFGNRHFVQVILVFFLIFSLMFDKLLFRFSFKKNPLFSFLLCLFVASLIIFAIYRVSFSSIKVISGFAYYEQEKEYLKFAQKVIPKDGIILSGMKGENLIWVSNFTKRSVVFNISQAEPYLIPYNKSVFHIPLNDINPPPPYYEINHTLKSDMVMRNIIVGNKNEFKKYNIYILDYDVQRWNELFSRKREGYPYVPADRLGVFYLKKVGGINGRSIYKLEMNNI